MEIGLQDDTVFLDQSGLSRQAGLNRAQELGVTTVRANLLWARVMTIPQARRPPRPAGFHYDFSRFDAFVADARARGLRVQLTLTGPAPAWATKGHTVSTRNPSVREFARFAAAV